MNLNKDVSCSSEGSSKNVARGAYIETAIESGFFVLTFQNDFDTSKLLEKDIDNSYLQFHFCLKGTTQFNFNQDSYSLDIPEGNIFVTASATEILAAAAGFIIAAGVLSPMDIASPETPAKPDLVIA